MSQSSKSNTGTSSTTASAGATPSKTENYIIKPDPLPVVYAAPKKRMTAYMIFCQERRKTKEAMGLGQMMKEIGKEWSQLDTLQKDRYQYLSQKEKERYQEELQSMPVNAIVKPMRQKRKKKDKSKPKKVMSPYIFYVKEERAKVVEANPQLSFTQIMKQLGEQWRALSDQEKETYKSKSEQDRVRHKEEHDIYINDKQSGGKSRAVKRDKSGMPKKPLSAYLLFANYIRGSLKKTRLNARVSDIMRATSKEWAKLNSEQKRVYTEEAKASKQAFDQAMTDWKQQQGKKVTDLIRMDDKKKQSIVSFLTHGIDFNEAGTFQPPPDKGQSNSDEQNTVENETDVKEFLQLKEMEEEVDNYNHCSLGEDPQEPEKSNSESDSSGQSQ